MTLTRKAEVKKVEDEEPIACWQSGCYLAVDARGRCPEHGEPVPEHEGDRWGRCLSHLHDEIGPFHLLRPDNAPACGVSYFSTTGTYPYEINDHSKCGRCKKIATKRARARELFGRGKTRTP
jgi:hypothetical protein